MGAICVSFNTNLAITTIFVELIGDTKFSFFSRIRGRFVYLTSCKFQFQKFLSGGLFLESSANKLQRTNLFNKITPQVFL